MLGRSMIFTCLRVFGAILICLRLKRILDAHGVTVTLQVRVVVVLLKKRKPFSLILTVIVAFPTFSPVSLQLVSESPESTDTTSLSLLLKDTVSLVIPSTVNSVSSDKSRSVEIIFKEYLDTASVFLRFFLDAADTDAVFARSENTRSSMIHRNKLCLCFMVIIPFIYIGYYVLFGGEMDMFAMMAVRSTHLKEIKDFLRTMGSPAHAVMAAAALAIVIACAVTLSRSLMRKARTFEGNIFRGSGKAFPIGLAVISILFFGGFYRQITHVFPASIIKALNSSGSEFQILQKLNDNLDKNVKTMTFLAPNPGSGIDEGTHIVIIGESANRDHMKAFTPDYPENTTPWLSEMAKSKDFALGYKAYSNFPNTLFSLSYAMTSANQYSDMSFEDVVSMVDVAKAAGYRTDWISFHNRSSMSSAGVTMIAERCDDSYWEKNYDGYTLEVLKKLPPAKKRIIFINIDGSHYTYLARVPVNLRDKLGISKEDPYHDYDLTIAYDDQVMKDIFEYAKANLNLKSMIYFSDHGENMKHYHTTSPFYYDMVHIPFFVYLSPDYQAAHPELMPALKSHEQQVFTNDLAFDTVTGIWQAKTNFYQSKYDFSSKDYAINMDNATTFERKKKIKDDPVWQGK